MSELLVDFITTLDGYASGEGWPGFWGLEGPEYLAWLSSQPEVSYLMGANTYRLMSGFAAGEVPPGQEEFSEEEAGSLDHSPRRRGSCSRTRWRSRWGGPTRRSSATTPSRRSAP